MIKNDIALEIEDRSEFSRAKSLKIVKEILDSLKEALAKNEKIEIRGFASFKVVSKKTGICAAPLTAECFQNNSGSYQG